MKRWQKNLMIHFAKFNKRAIYTLMFLAIALVLFASMYNNVKPELLNDVKPLTIAERTIRSPITMVDEQATESKRNEALSQVQPVNILKHEYAQNRVALISSIFDSAQEVLNQVEQMRQQSQFIAEDEEELPVFIEPTLAEKMRMLEEKLSETVLADLSQTTFRALLNSTKSDLQIAKDTAVTAVNNAMTKRIPANQVENAKRQVEDEIRYISLPSELKNATIELGRYAVIQNEFFDPEATEQRRQQTIETVEPVRILQGQIIVEEGKLITDDIYRQLDIIGLLDTKQPVLPYIGLTLFVLIILGFIYSFFTSDKNDLEQKNKEIIIFTVVLVISVVLMKLVSIIPFNKYDLMFVFPAALCAMLIKILLNDRLAFMSSVVLAAVGTILFNAEASGSFNFSAGLYILFSSIAGIIFLTNQNQRSKIFQAGLFVALINIIVIAFLHFIPNSQYNALQYSYYFLMGLGSGLGSAVLTIGFMPFFEASFGLTSTIKLIELSNPNHPLLKKILTEAPGTYHHSIMVANLADSACEAIGANGLLARVSCYYHDIGKTVRPKYFIENQLNIDNPHNQLDPVVSKDIIISHTTDGAEILKKHHMPKEIVDIARQHHGTGLLKFFYHKAKEAGQDVNESEFRYAGPKVQTKEAAVINIADSVEAAVRSMSNPNKEKIEQLVKNIIKERINDNQFNECDITLKELEIVEKTLCETLHGIFHNRIEYPELKEER